MADVAARAENGQPVLLGTVSIEKSEKLSKELEHRGVKHEVLNAKHHAREADIIAQAGRPGAVTVATNMAGRGVDIKLGGNPDGMARTELKRRGITHDDPSYEELEQKLTQEFEDQITPDKQRVIDAGGTWSARSVTSHAASTTSSEGRSGARVTRGSPASTYRSKTT